MARFHVWEDAFLGGLTPSLEAMSSMGGIVELLMVVFVLGSLLLPLVFLLPPLLLLISLAHNFVVIGSASRCGANALTMGLFVRCSGEENALPIKQHLPNSAGKNNNNAIHTAECCPVFTIMFGYLLIPTGSSQAARVDSQNELWLSQQTSQ